jgi:hypothetical protein
MIFLDSITKFDVYAARFPPLHRMSARTFTVQCPARVAERVYQMI